MGRPEQGPSRAGRPSRGPGGRGLRDAWRTGDRPLDELTGGKPEGRMMNGKKDRHRGTDSEPMVRRGRGDLGRAWRARCFLMISRKVTAWEGEGPTHAVFPTCGPRSGTEPARQEPPTRWRAGRPVPPPPPPRPVSPWAGEFLSMPPIKKFHGGCFLPAFEEKTLCLKLPLLRETGDLCFL